MMESNIGRGSAAAPFFRNERIGRPRGGWICNGTGVPALALALSIGALAAPWQVRAAPAIPADPSVVLETLRDTPLDRAARELRSMRIELNRNPANLELAVALARRYIETSRSRGDPRYLGYAQSALGPWWTLGQPPETVLLLRATIRQSNHDFVGALDDLAQLLRASPGNAQAWLMRATILQVRGQYAEATRSCDALEQRVQPHVLAVCRAGSAALSGAGEDGYRLLQQAQAQAQVTRSPITEQVWVATALAELAARLSMSAEAEQHFRGALQLDAADPYLKAAYADFLLDAARPADVVRLLAADTRIDGLLLRLALAEKQLGAATLPARVAELQARFEAARARGDRVHMREEARFRLSLRGETKAALQLARDNWAVQKEPADARILLEAALAARDRPAARPVLDWMAANRVQDPALARLARALESA